MPIVHRIGLTAGSVRRTTQSLMKNHTTGMGRDYPADEYTISKVTRSTSKDYKAFEKRNNVKVYKLTLKKRR